MKSAIPYAMSELLIADDKTVRAADEFRRRKTTAVLAIAFTDIVGSTDLREKLGETRYEALREEFESRFSAEICRDDAGTIVKGTGDGALAVFAEPSTAVERCLAVQESLRNQELIRLRIGLDMGQVSVKSSFGIVADVFGRQVNRAARIEALAAPGHILTSFQVYDCAVGWLRGANVAWHNHGAVPLKGFDDDVSIHEIYDPRYSSPQAGSSFPRSIDPSLSTMAAHRMRADDVSISASMNQSERSLFHRGLIRASDAWKALLEALKTQPIKVRAAPYIAGLGDPISDSAGEVTALIDMLAKVIPESPSILWVDDYPENNIRECKVLRGSGCVVDVALTTEQAQEKLKKKQYLLIITDMGRGGDTTAGLDLLRWRREQQIVAPVILYASPSAIAIHSETALAEGCALCTAGLVSLWQGIGAVFSEYLERFHSSAEREISNGGGSHKKNGQ